jgi:hypothetical protein
MIWALSKTRTIWAHNSLWKIDNMGLDANNILSGGGRPVDIAGAIDKGNVTAHNAMITENLRKENQDEQVMQDYMRVPGTDLHTSKGVEQALGHLQGRITPKAYAGVIDRLNSLRNSETQYAAGLRKATKDQLEQEEEETNYIVDRVGPIIEKETDPDVWAQKRDATLESVAKDKLPNGQPRLSPEIIGKLKTLPKSAFDAMYSISGNKQTQIKLAKQEAETKLTNARAAATEGLGSTEEWTDTAGNTYLKGTKNGKTVKIGSEGELIPVVAMPPGSVKLGARPDTGAAKLKAGQELLDFEKNPPSPAEEQMARTYMVSRKMESLGQNSPLRPRIAMLAAKIAVDEGRDVLADNTAYKAETGNVNNMTKQYGVIKSGEQTVLGNLELMKGLVDKVDDTGVPALERWTRAGKRAIEGDPDVTKLDALVQSTQADIAKVLSAATGAGGVPVEALKKAQKYMGENLTSDQFKALYEIVPKEMAVRTDKMEAQIAGSLNKIRRLTQAPGAKTSSSDEVTLPEPEARQELKLAREKVRTATDPEQKRLATEVMRKLESALGGRAADTAPVERRTSKSGKPMIKVDGQWVYE